MEGRIAKTEKEEEQNKLIQNLNNNYVHWDKFKDMQLPNPDYRISVWAKLMAERSQGFTRQLTVDNLSIKWWLSNNMEAMLHQLDIGLASGKGMQTLLEPKYEHRYRTNALLDESIASAQLAGLAVSKKSAKEMLLKKRIPQNINEQACLNIFRSLQIIIEKKNEALTENLLLQIHQTLTKDSIKLKGIGNYRTNNKVDLSSLDLSAGYKPVDAKLVSELMQFIIDLYNNDSDPFFIHPLVKASLIHYLIVTIRPFKDGNGRIARLLTQMYLLKKEYWMMEFIAVSNVISKFKPQYHKSIIQSQSDENNAGYFLHFYVQSVLMAYKSLNSFVEKSTREKEEKPTNKILGLNERQSSVLQWINEDKEKMVTIRELRSLFGISKETARTDLATLVEKGWIKYYNINKKTYAFVKADAFDELMKKHGT